MKVETSVSSLLDIKRTIDKLDRFTKDDMETAPNLIHLSYCTLWTAYDTICELIQQRDQLVSDLTDIIERGEL